MNDLSTAGHDFADVYIGHFTGIHIYAIYSYGYSEGQVLPIVGKLRTLNTYNSYNTVEMLEVIDAKDSNVPPVVKKIELNAIAIDKPEFLRTERLMLPNIGVLIEMSGENTEHEQSYAFAYIVLDQLEKLLKDQLDGVINLVNYDAVVKESGEGALSPERRSEIYRKYYLSSEKIALYLKPKLK